jgi:hypothetical protein
VLLGIVWACCGGIQAQTFAPQGSEFNLSGAINGDQVAPALSINTSGGYLVWQDNGIDTNGWGIGALKLSASLSRSGDPFRVNTVQKGNQEKPSIALLTGGGAMVAWQSSGIGKGASNHIYARFLGPDGSFLTQDVQVEPAFARRVRAYTTNLFGYRVNLARNFRFRILESWREERDRVQGPAVAALPDGGAVIVYSGFRRCQTNTSQLSRSVTVRGLRWYTNDVLRKVTLNCDWGQEVFFQRFSATGQKLGGEVLVNQFSTFDQRHPSVAALPNGNFIVVWVSERAMPTLLHDPGEVQISARLFGSSGEPLSDEFDVTPDPVIAATPSVSPLADGRFTVAWAQSDVHNRTNTWDVYARFFSPDGAAVGDPFRVNSYLKYPQVLPKVASIGLNQMLVWTSWNQDRSMEGVYGQFLSEGSRSDGELRVNTEIVSKQINPVVASDGVGRFVAAWASFVGSSGFDILAQRYHTTQPDGFVFPAAVASRSSLEWVSAASVALSKSAAGHGSASNLQVSWLTQPGASYQLQMSTNLATWTDVGSARLADRSTDSLLLDTALPAAFYRVIRVP